MRFGAGLLALAALATGLTACGNSGADSIVDKAKNDKKLVVGIKIDQPGWGLKKPDGSYGGFDVDVARYVAKELGVPESGITFKEAQSANREPFIQQGQVDMVVATYSITDERKQKISFAGPYLVTGQDILVRADDTSITGVESLKDKKVCGAQGSSSPKRLADKFGPEWESKNLTQQQGYGACLPLLENNQVDAISTDATILAGFAAQFPGKFKLIGQPFSEERYGIGIKKDDKAGRDAINNAIEKFFNDGSWRAALDANLGEFGKYFTTPPAVDRY
ncbi:glutamate ABC transporter substrate-binding protein [Microbispora hainanensis]|uniref:Glutamate ABC transporter substrate-binding protein n=1 Tax=Microbispora hainanensis TaxID=568844 RepID=A0ABZ1SQW0_9ACTN|nr:MULTISPECIES: glutamate ABC transporter substrate-binding protein [Microbispora]NJP28160.1 glutamate ABC transporter substrate-binding protein [Microbispora sp. CL1-1]TQS09342.1 glutamate ABC transporter substrate-binding protein [Microbispora sp. SCL1-1]